MEWTTPGTSRSSDRKGLAEVRHRSNGQRIENPTLHSKHEGHLIGEPQRRMLRLVEDGSNSRTARKLMAHPRVRHAAEAGEHFELQKLRVVQPHGLRRVAQGVRLRFAADAADADTDIDRRFLPFVEELRIEHDLAIGNGDEIGRDIGAEVSGIGLGDRQRGQRATAPFLREFCGAFEQPRWY